MPQTTINPALHDFDQLPDSAQVRLPIVKALLSVSSATCWRLVKNKKLTTYKLTERTTTFNVGELKKFLASKESV
jgi:predicted DNA-binding transcriptional regulator AlpA